MTTTTTIPRFIALTLSVAGLLSACSTVQPTTKAKATTKAESTPAASADDGSSDKASAALTMSAGPGRHLASLALPTGDPKTSAIMLTKSAPEVVNVGEEFEYRFEVTNLTDLTLDNVVVTDPLPPEFRVSKITPDVGMGSQWALGNLLAGASKTIIVTGAAEREGNLSSCGSVSYENSVCLATSVLSPGLELMARGPAGDLTICDDIPITYTVANPGTGTVNNVVLNGSFPAGLRDDSGDQTFSRNLGSIKPGETVDVVFKLRADKSGTFSHEAVAEASGNLQVRSNAVSTVVRMPALAIEMSGPKEAYIGRNTKYSVKVTNTGDTIAMDAIVKLAMPSSATFVSATRGGQVVNGNIVWNLGNMPLKAAADLQFQLKAAKAGPIRPMASAEALCAEAVMATTTTQMKGIPAILIEVVDQEDPVVVGEKETYTITVTNQGTAPGTTIQITATLPENTQYISSGGVTNGKFSNGRVTFAPLPSLAPKGTASWTVVIVANEPSDARFHVSMMSDQLGKRPVEETEATTFYN